MLPDRGTAKYTAILRIYCRQTEALRKNAFTRSFTCDIPSHKGKRKCEQLAAEWAATKEATIAAPNIAVGEAIDKYIQQRSAVLSPATVKEYKASRKRDLQELMDVKLDVFTQEQIQKAINRECLTHSPKTVRNMHGLLTAAIVAYRPDFAIKTDCQRRSGHHSTSLPMRM